MKPVAFATVALLCACSDPEAPTRVEAEPEDVSSDAPDGASEIEELVEADVEEPTDDSIPVAAIMEVLDRPAPHELSTEDRDRAWDLDHLPQEDAEATALLRIWSSEIELSNEGDLIGIWQVVQNVRARHCDNTRFNPAARKRLTQCRTPSGDLVVPGPQEAVEGAQETYLSAMRRLSDRALGAAPALSARGRWIAEISLDCEEPESWNRDRPWDQVMGPLCEEYAPLARGLLDGSVTRRLSPASIIAWGGRCERHCDDPADPSTCRQTGACDDRIACRRGLVRIPDTSTDNAFWCRPGSRHCPTGTDPVCAQLLEETVGDVGDSVTDLTGQGTTS